SRFTIGPTPNSPRQRDTLPGRLLGSARARDTFSWCNHPLGAAAYSGACPRTLFHKDDGKGSWNRLPREGWAVNGSSVAGPAGALTYWLVLPPADAGRLPLPLSGPLVWAEQTIARIP